MKLLICSKSVLKQQQQLLLLYTAHELTEPGMPVQQWFPICLPRQFHLATSATGKSCWYLDQLMMVASSPAWMELTRYV
jgi:hypothetical protein